MAKRITFLLGNGAAIPWGARTTDEITRMLCTDPNIPKTTEGVNICQYLKDKIIAYGHDEDKITFETLVNVLEDTHEYFAARLRNQNRFFHFNLPFLFEKQDWIESLKNFTVEDHGTFYWFRSDLNIYPQLPKEHFSHSETIDFHYFNNLLAAVLERISVIISGYCLNIDNKPKYNDSLRKFINYLCEKGYIVRFYTTNYDRLLPEVFGEEKVFDGFENPDSESKRFQNYPYDLNKIYNEKDILNYYNLHGCLYWDFDSNVFKPFADYQYHFYRTFETHTDIAGPTEHSPNASELIKIWNIITGLKKVQRLAMNPLNAFYSAFQEDCVNSDLLVTVGYSFGDPHLNNFIKNGVGYDDTNFLHVTKINKEKHSPTEAFFDSDEGGSIKNLEPVQNDFPQSQDISDGWMTSEKGTHRIFTDGFDGFLLNERFKEINI
jgi:hypothetical protein